MYQAVRWKETVSLWKWLFPNFIICLLNRCGNSFCATHRYAETHNCNYDYKTEGRKLLEQSNPLVVAPKLPKI
jgi:predicted transcriptional regulator